MKKRYAYLLGFLVLFSLFSCSKKEDKSKKSLMVGLVTDSGTIEDRSFNQGAWKGIKLAEKNLGIKKKYIKPKSSKEEDCIAAIKELCEEGYKLLICPGYAFETAVYDVQGLFKDVMFVILDGNAHPADSFDAANGPNTVGITFLENEAGFLAAVAAALELKKGSFGFIGGMEIPSVQRFNWGWQQGIIYANENLGCEIELKAENVVYQGSFDDILGGEKLASEMYDRGVDVIHAAAGAVGVGVIEEAKKRTEAGQRVWVVGVDVDQYDLGLMINGESVVLTSAMKYIDRATYDMINDAVNAEFRGGYSLLFSVKDDAIGIPAENPNLSSEVQSKIDNLIVKIKAGEVKVSNQRGSLLP